MNETIIEQVFEEYDMITEGKRKLASAHEGYAMLLEKTDDLWDEVTVGQHRLRMERYAIQIAAAALRFINDIC